MYDLVVVVVIRYQPEPPAVAIVRQNGLSSASSRASVADTPVSRQIWWTQVNPGGRFISRLFAIQIDLDRKEPRYKSAILLLFLRLHLLLI